MEAERERPYPFRFRITQFRGARRPLYRGLTESHGADRQGGPLAGFCAPTDIFPLEEGLTDSWGSLAGFREAAGESDLGPLAVDDDAHHPAFALAACLPARTTKINPGVRSSVCSPRGGLRKKASVMRIVCQRASWRAISRSRVMYGLK